MGRVFFDLLLQLFACRWYWLLTVCWLGLFLLMLEIRFSFRLTVEIKFGLFYLRFPPIRKLGLGLFCLRFSPP